MSQNSYSNLSSTLRFTFLMWAIFMLEQAMHYDLGFLGIYPLKLEGLVGILFSPLIHGNWIHLLSNTFPFMFLSGMLYIFYAKIADRVFYQCYFITGILVWLFGRPLYHVGASGLIYGIAFFLISVGFLMKNFKSMMISIVVTLLYGGLFYGMLPTKSYISFESHLLGGIVGIASAVSIYKFSKRKLL